ncbi:MULTISPECIES: SDR family oxidoreductase [Rhizobium]|uniref:Serine 3-dehydrogenase n=6 Tax=Rhizobium TaxID=379 RepID=Q8KKW9_RHIEC|nr:MULTISPECIES: SDR family oxidoreductase [Rhizobium]AAM55011.2 putative oxidoreductase protein [Rhizobium etli CFN 42]AJC82142.1 short-chain dehydrogenase/reductase SDR family protein [Rhizobium etli bv. phaseoli str. IE4803]APO77359.1 short-chain dehydrogenase/reductase SDR family protein [Rhizobium etli 8C-3]ARO26696.1 short-chain dehydrogenase/reductase SDR family protein [Rhizobium sp. TAL182]ARQ60576.1 short-chain dehydrogenase/reductase SDR family protein [Rhizobium sp. Kim5]EGE58689.
MSHLKNKVAIVTGASSGIGAATARGLAEKGARVVLAGRNEERLSQIVEDITGSGGIASYKVADATDFESTKALVAFATTTYGPVDILVNNAGLMLFSYWKDAAVGDWNKMIDTNLRGYLHAIAAVLPSMLERRSGRILNMSSIAGVHVGEAAGVYGATKFFIRGITESLRKEVGVGSGIQVSMISPGVIDTGWADKVHDETGRKIAGELNKQGIPPSSVAEAVVYALDQPPEITINDISSIQPGRTGSPRFRELRTRTSGTVRPPRGTNRCRLSWLWTRRSSLHDDLIPDVFVFQRPGHLRRPSQDPTWITRSNF